MPTRCRCRGLTLVELLIVLVVIAVLVTIALPSLLRARLSANETQAVVTLRLLHQAQAQFSTSRAADLNGNGMGEYGTIGEIGGAVPVRAAFGGVKPLAPSFVSRSLGRVSALGEMQKGGYLFGIYLPDAAGDGVPELPGGGAAPAVDAVRAEMLWCAYAWPMDYGSSGLRTFFVNQAGSVSAADEETYTGPGAPIPPGSALVPGAADTNIEGTQAVGGLGRDGNLWVVVGN